MQNTMKNLSLGRLLRSVLISVVVLLLLLLVTAVLISEEVLPLDMGKIYLACALVLAAGVSGGLLAGGRHEKKMQAALLNAGGIFLLLLLHALITGRGSVSGGQVVFLAGCVATGSITGCVLVIMNPLRRKRR